MHVLKAEDYLRGVEPGKINLQTPLPADQLEKLPSLHTLHQDIEGTGILLDSLHSKNEGMAQLLLEGHLVEDVIHLLVLYQLVLGEDLDGIGLIGLMRNLPLRGSRYFSQSYA